MNYLPRKFFAATALLLLTNLALAAATPKPSPRVEMKTSEGAIIIELNEEKAPVSTANFLQYVKDGFYDGLIFHRVIKGFMIQGGAHFPNMSMKPPRESIINEAKNGLKNEAGAIAMARTSNPDSASSQFFINLASNESLDYPAPDGHGYAVFGKVVSGFDIVQKIGSVKTGYAGFTPDVPKTPVIIESVKVLPATK